MRVIHVDTGREMRGGQWQVLRLLEGLRAAGVETWLVARAGAPLFAKAVERELPVVPLTMPALRQRAGLVHAHDARAHALAIALARAPVVVSRRVAFPIRAGLLSRWKYGQAAHFIAVSQFVRRELVACGVPERRVSVVYDGVPLLPATENGHRVLAPPPSPDKPAAWYAQCGVDVCFATNLETDLRTASLFLYLSNSEGLGSAVLLAMAAGVPVIASETGGLAEIIRHEENGLLVDGSPTAVAAAVRRLQSDPAFAGTLGARGRRHVAENFSIERMVCNTLAVYQQVLSC